MASSHAQGQGALASLGLSGQPEGRGMHTAWTLLLAECGSWATMDTPAGPEAPNVIPREAVVGVSCKSVPGDKEGALWS